MKKILVVVDSINVNDSSGSKANVALINNLVEGGFDILVYHYTRINIQLKNVDCISIPEKKITLLYFLSRSQRVFTKLSKLNLAPFFEKIFGFSFTFFNDTYSIKEALLKCNFEPDLIITLSKGASFRPHYALLGLPELHSKWMAYVHDPYPMHYYPRPYNFIEVSYKQKQQFFLEVSQKARYSAFPSLLLKDWMGSYFQNFNRTAVIIPHQNAPYEIKIFEFPTYFAISKFNILHAGNLMAQRSPKGLMDGFILFLQNNPDAQNNARLLLLGTSTDHSQMMEEYKRKYSEIYISEGNVSFDDVYQIQKRVSVNVILEAISEISPFLPGKFPHCVAANRTILSLAPYNSETRRLLGDDYPYWAEQNDSVKIASIIEKLYHLWKQNPVNLLLNRKDLEDYLSAENLKKVIINL